MANIFYIDLGSNAAQSFEDKDIKPPGAADGFKTGDFQRTDFQTTDVVTRQNYDVYTADLDPPHDQESITSYLKTTFPKKFKRSWPKDYRDDPDYAGLINLYTEVQTPEFFDITFPATQGLKTRLLEIFTNPEDPGSSPIQVLGQYNNSLYKVRIRFGDEKKLSPFERGSLQKFLEAFQNKPAGEIAEEYGTDVLNLYFFAKENAEPPLTFLGEKTVLGGVGPNDLVEIPALWFHSIARKTSLRQILGEKSYIWLLNHNSKDKKKDYVPYVEVAKFAEVDGYKRGWLYHTFYGLSEGGKREIHDLLERIQTQAYYARFEYTEDGVTYQVLLYLDPISHFGELQVFGPESNFQLRGFDDDEDGIWTFQTSSEEPMPITKEILESITAWWQDQTPADRGGADDITQKQFEVLEKGLLARFEDNPPEGMAP